MYSIKVRYTTGDTFGSSEEERNLDISWDTIEKAKKELKKLKEHWMYLKGIDSRSNSAEVKKKLKSKAFMEDWYCHGDYNYNFYMDDNDGQRVKIYAFWMGYFETLHYAEIVAINANSDEMQIDFDELRNNYGFW